MRPIILTWLLIAFALSPNVSAQETTNWQTFDEYNSRYPGTHALALYLDSEGLLWIGTRGTGVVSYNDQVWKNYTQQSGLADNVVHAIAQDSKGMWFGTKNNGVSFYDGQTWRSYQSDSGLANNFVRAIAIEREKVWFATAAGVSLLDTRENKWSKYTTRGEYELIVGEWQLKRPYAIIEGLPLNEIWDLKLTANGELWIGTYNGLAKFNNVNWNSYRPPEYPMSDNEIKCLAVDSDGGLWVGTHTGGLIYFLNDEWTTYSLEDGLAHSEVTAITITTNSVWVGTNGGGISRFDKKNSWTNYTTKDGLSSNFVASLTSSGSRIWAGFYGPGISRFEEEQ